MMSTPVNSDRWLLTVVFFSGRKMEILKQKNEAIAMVESSRLIIIIIERSGHSVLK